MKKNDAKNDLRIDELPWGNGYVEVENELSAAAEKAGEGGEVVFGADEVERIAAGMRALRVDLDDALVERDRERETARIAGEARDRYYQDHVLIEPMKARIDALERERDEARQIAETLQRDYNAAAWEAAAWDAERRWQMRRLAGERDEARRERDELRARIESGHYAGNDPRLHAKCDVDIVRLAGERDRALAELRERAEAHDKADRLHAEALVLLAHALAELRARA